jgi:thiol-disulfide isomerase/thioredoxin
MSDQVFTQQYLMELCKNLPSKHIIILKFTAEWCGPCATIKPLCDAFIKNKPNNILYFEIDIDNSLDLYIKLKKYKILNGIPALLAYYPGEREHWYVSDDCQLDSNKDGVIQFFNRCLNYVK